MVVWLTLGGISDYNSKRSALELLCPFFQSKVLENKCDGSKCAWWVEVHGDGVGTPVLFAGCGVKYQALALRDLLVLLSGRTRRD